jgi:hypothetical protein
MTRYIDPDITQGVNIGFTAIVIVPLITIMCITLARAPRSKDPARVTTTYFKAMLPFAVLYVNHWQCIHNNQTRSVTGGFFYSLVMLKLVPLTLL